MTDHVTPKKARELAGTLDLTQYAEHSDALMSLASQAEKSRALLVDWLELGDSQPILPDRIYELRERTRALLSEGNES